MGDYTFLRVEIENDTVAGLIGKVPGVAAVEDLPAEEPEQPSNVDSEDFDPDSGASAVFETDDDSSGRKERLVGLAREWGLLGLGISLVGLGTATAGLWFYRRRKQGDEETDDEWETPAVASGGETPPPTAVEATDRDVADSEPESVTAGTQSETVLAETDVDEGRDESIDEEWVTRTELDSDDTAESAADKGSDEGTDEEPAEYDSIDAAPLVGMTFLVILGALVKWAQGNAEDEA